MIALRGIRYFCFGLILFMAACDPEDMVVAYDYDGPPYFAEKLYSSHSPDGTKYLEMGERGNDSTGWCTQILVDHGNGGGGGIYTARGKDLDIKTYWKTNDTIIVETKKSYRADVKWNQSQIFTSIIKVIYIEN